MKHSIWMHWLVVLGLLVTLAGTAGMAPAALAQAREPATLYVQPGGSGDCSDWGSDACELQAALDAAQSGDEIWVAAGTYLPDYDPITGIHTGDRSESFQLVSGVALYGGFPGTGEPDFGDRDWSTYVTILSGDIGTAEVDTDNSYHVVYGTGVTETAILDGFTITGGNASGSAEPDWDGGGMYNDDSSPTVSHCTFSNNRADQDGGGMHNGNESNPTLINVTFSNNSASLDGGGMHNHPYSNPTLTNVTFVGNTAVVDGGGMSNGDSSPTLTNVTFNANTAGRYGGGMYNWNSNPDLTNCILWGNTATTDGNQIYNSDEGSTPSIGYSDVQGGCDTIPGNDCDGGNIDADPRFVDAAAGDLRLRFSSPAIDAGDNSAAGLAGITADLGGNPRFTDVPSVPDTGNGDPPIVDMGAYEAPPDVIHVDQDATGDNSGTSWADAFTHLQHALRWAQGGVEIWVATGTYTPTWQFDTDDPRSAAFQMVNGVAIYGGFDPSAGDDEWEERDWETNPTILSGDIGTEEDASDNSYHVFYHREKPGSSAILDGFTISGGNATGDYPHYRGGGMYNYKSSPTLTNCTFAGNSAGLDGGGMLNWVDGSPTLTNCTFKSNSSSQFGGGMHNIASAPTLTDLVFIDNSARLGGGLYNHYSSPVLTNVAFIGNEAEYGGGMHAYNSAEMLTNCTFSGNTATYGGGLYNRYSTPVLTNCILWGDTAGTGPEIYNLDSTADVSYSDIQGGYTGEGNIDTDPLFVNPGSGDVHLGPGSPCIDAGDNSALPAEITTDLGGHPRFVDIPSVPDTGYKEAEDDRPFVDMGAYEAQYFTLSVTKAGTGSGTVNSDPPGIDCGVDCTEELFQATVITLTATADSGSIFGGWSGACTGGGDCVIAMDGNQVVTGTFTLQHQLSVSLSGTGNGTVTSQPPGIVCGADCTEVFDHGTPVTLTAVADSDSIFDGWSGACSGSGDCPLTIDSDQVVTGTFTLADTGHEVYLPLIVRASP